MNKIIVLGNGYIGKKAYTYFLENLENIYDVVHLANYPYNTPDKLKETLKSRDYTRQHDYQFLIDENRRLEEERNELLTDNKKLAAQIDEFLDKVNQCGKASDRIPASDILLFIQE